MPAEIVLPRSTDTVAPPVAQGAHNAVQQGVICVDCPALAHRYMMRRVEARRAEITDRARIACLAAHRILRAKRVAVVLDEPEIVCIAE